MATPNDLARRGPAQQGQTLPVSAVGIAVVSRTDYQRRVRSSALPPSTRLLAHTLATYADDNAVIPPEFQPSIRRLRASTGLFEARLRAGLDALEAAGWIARPPRVGESTDPRPITLTRPIELTRPPGPGKPARR